MLEDIGSSMIAKAAEQMLYHFNVPFKDGRLLMSDVESVSETPLRVGVVAIFRGPGAQVSVDGLINNLMGSIRLEKIISDDTEVREFHFRRDFSAIDSEVECFIYGVE